MNFKLILAIIIAVIIGNLIRSDVAFAHPIDNTYTYLFIEKVPEGDSVPENEIKGYFYVNWYIVDALYYQKTGKSSGSFEELAANMDMVREYVQNSIVLTNNGSRCSEEVYKPSSPDQEQVQTLDAEVIITYKCNEKISKVTVDNKLAIEIFPYISNFTTLQKNQNILERLTLGTQTTMVEFDVSELIKNPVGDISEDFSAGLSADEILNNKSTDQNPRDTIRGNNILAIWTEKIFGMTNTFKDQSPFILVILVLVLGLLHTLEAGHSKAVLASSMLHHGMSFKRGILYALVFTATHLGDIVVMGILFMIVNNFYDIFGNFTLVEKFAGYAVFFLSLYMLVNSISDMYKRKMMLNSGNKRNSRHVPGQEQDNSAQDILTSKKISFKEQVIMGILTGLAPCIFGWSIFMLVISTGQIWLLFPVILAFGIGIFIALSLVVLLLSSFKVAAYPRILVLAEYSPIISAIFLLGYSIFLVL